MEISRRKILSGASIVAGALAAAPAEACSVVASLKPISFSDNQCRRSLRALIELINAAPTLSQADLSARTDELPIYFDNSVRNQILPDVRLVPFENADLISGWSMSNGKRDRSPVKLHEVNLLKNEKSGALYQFTLRRDSYHLGYSEEQAEQDGCGFSPYDSFYGLEKTSYLGRFRNNKLREISAFDAWLQIA